MERKLLQSDRLSGEHRSVPSKASHPNGTGRCKVHPQASSACRACLVEGLREFRHANVRAGTRLAIERVKKLRTNYLSMNGAKVKLKSEIPG